MMICIDAFMQLASRQIILMYVQEKFLNELTTLVREGQACRPYLTGILSGRAGDSWSEVPIFERLLLRPSL